MMTPLAMAEERLAAVRRLYEETVRRHNPDTPADALIPMQGSLEELLVAERVRRALIEDSIAIGPDGDPGAFIDLLNQDEMAQIVEEVCRAVMIVEGLLLAAGPET
jgi:hypothetical protein